MAAAKVQHGVLVQLKDSAALVRDQGGIGAAIQSLATGLGQPQILEGTVYAALATKLKTALDDQNVDATVTVVDPAGYRKDGGATRDIMIGVAGGAVFAGLVFLVNRWRKR